MFCSKRALEVKSEFAMIKNDRLDDVISRNTTLLREIHLQNIYNIFLLKQVKYSV